MEINPKFLFLVESIIERDLTDEEVYLLTEKYTWQERHRVWSSLASGMIGGDFWKNLNYNSPKGKILGHHDYNDPTPIYNLEPMARQGMTSNMWNDYGLIGVALQKLRQNLHKDNEQILRKKMLTMVKEYERIPDGDKDKEQKMMEVMTVQTELYKKMKKEQKFDKKQLQKGNVPKKDNESEQKIIEKYFNIFGIEYPKK